jgi:hypothetical protein
MIFAKNQEVYFLALKGKTTGFQRNRQQLAQNSKNTSEGCRNKTRADMRIPGGLLFMWGVFSSFRFRVLVAASQKNPILVLQKWKVIALGGFQLLLGSAYIETLVRWVHAVYPFDFPPTMVDRWTFYFILFG